MKLFFPLIIYILRARHVFGIPGTVLRVWGRKREKREEDGFSGVPGGGCPTGGFTFPEREERDGRADGSSTGILQVSGIPVRLMLF